MAKRMPRPRLAGLDPTYVLVVKPEKGKSPTKFLTNTVDHPGEPPETSELAKARTWIDSSGPRHYLARHPKLKKRFVSWRIYAVLPKERAAALERLTSAPAGRSRARAG